MNKKAHEDLLRRLAHLEILESAVGAGFRENEPVLLRALTSIVKDLIRDIKPTA
jgi:hypothetical protein